jgi:hypothetical protein
MNVSTDSAMPPAPFFHEDSGAVRFWVLDDSGLYVGATISRETLHFQFQSGLAGADAVASYLQHHREIDAAGRRRIAAGSIEPVMLRERDVSAQAGDGRVRL